MGKRSLSILLVVVALVAAGCSSSSDDAIAGEQGATAPTTDFDYSSVDYDAESDGSALTGDRESSSFPPAVIDISSIASGGPPPDGIPPIDEPKYASVDEVDFVADSEAVIAVEVEGDARAFPISIMIWHEIVNTEIGGAPVTVSYCPLCNSAVAYDRRLGERVLDFGTSGELYQSALVMYDRQTESLWTHFDGRGVVGHYAGAQLEFLSAQTVSFAEWKEVNPDGMVLTTDTGADRNYGANPYVGYDTEGSEPLDGFFNGEVDSRLLAKARIVGIEDDAGALAVQNEAVAESGVLAVNEDGRNLVVFSKDGLASALDDSNVADGQDIEQTGVFVAASEAGERLTFSRDGEVFVDGETGSTWNIFGKAIDGELKGEQLESVPHHNTFWFAWATYQPDTAIIS